MTSQVFIYNKGKVIQALRYHFISRKEIKIMMILVNIFAIVSATLFFFKLVSPLAFLVSSVLWFALMISFWFIMPTMVYRRSTTFKEELRVTLGDNELTIENERGYRAWPWKDFTSFTESPHFFHLYFNSRSFFIIPKDAFEGDDVHEARKMLVEKIRNKE